MFVGLLGIFCMFLLCCCNEGEAKGSLTIKNRTSVALAGETLKINISVTVPSNKSGTIISCFRDNGLEVWKHKLNQYAVATEVQRPANIIMHNSSFSGEYRFTYLKETHYWVVLVRDEGYPMLDEVLDTDVITLLVVMLILFIFSIIGSVYIFKWHKDQPQPEENGDGLKGRERRSNAGVISQGANSESVYTSLEPRPVSIYDVLSVDQARRETLEKRTSQETAKTSQADEGIFESVYENL